MNKEYIVGYINQGCEKYFLSLSDEDKIIVNTFIEIMDFIKNIEELFSHYVCNKKIMANTCAIDEYDNIIFKNDYGENQNILINVLVTNLISSGKTFTEFLETFFKYVNDSNIIEKITFKEDVLSQIYDDSFSYRFIYLLRNLSQHGSFIVNISNGQCFFDINYILDNQHFTYNKKMRVELEKICEEIFEKYEDNAKYEFYRTIKEYDDALEEIYLKAIDECITIYDSIAPEFKAVMERKLKLIPNYLEKTNGMIFLNDGNKNHGIPYICALNEIKPYLYKLKSTIKCSMP